MTWPPCENRAGMHFIVCLKRVPDSAARIKVAGDGRSIDPGLVTGRREIARLYFEHRSGAVPTGSPLRVMSGWRAELLGDPLRALLDGRADFRFSWSKGGPAAAVEFRL